MSTVIIGAGIIGVSTAYYLSQLDSIDPSTIHLIEATPALFSSASGYAGGFLAEDWFSSAAAELGALSFAEHKRVAEEHGGKERWGYSSSRGTTYAPAKTQNLKGDRSNVDVWCREGTSRVDAAPDEVTVSGEKADRRIPTWLTRVQGDSLEFVSEEGSTAQVDPLKLCQFFLFECQKRGVQIHNPAKATSIGKDAEGRLSSLTIARTDSAASIQIPCTHILIAAGAWSPQVFRTLFPTSSTKLPITSLAGHSLVVQSPRWQREHESSGCHAVFTTDDQGYSPEIFSRMGGEIYVAGANSTSLPLPESAEKTAIDEEIIGQLHRTAKRLLGNPDMEDLQEVRKGLCFRPVTGKGTPILSRIGDEKLGDVETKTGGDGGVFLAAGHGPWGISMSLGTGKIMAELLTGKPTSADVSRLCL